MLYLCIMAKLKVYLLEEGNYEIETEIIPLLSTLKGFKFGFKSGLKAEVLFINTKEFQVKWGTKSPSKCTSTRKSQVECL